MDTLYRASIEDREKLRVRERERERKSGLSFVSLVGIAIDFASESLLALSLFLSFICRETF